MLLAVPFSLVGSFWFLYLMSYNMSIAVWVGIIALAGISAETGMVMLLFLDLAYEQLETGRPDAQPDRPAGSLIHGAVKRLRPKVMTVATTSVSSPSSSARDGRRCDEAHRRPHDRRTGHLARSSTSSSTP